MLLGVPNNDNKNDDGHNEKLSHVTLVIQKSGKMK